MRKKFLMSFWSAVALLLSWQSAALAAGASSPWSRTDFADVRLISAVSGTEGQEQVQLGLEFRLEEDWKVYWRSAGDAGYPPELTYDGSSNLKETKVDYAVPVRFSLFGLETYGYKDKVVYPITAQLSEAGQPLEVRAKVHALACSDICVPLEADLALTLPAGPAEPTVFTQLLDRWTARVPQDIEGFGFQIERAIATGDPKSPTLELTISGDAPLDGLDLFPEAPKGLSFGKPEVVLASTGNSATVRVPTGVQGDVQLEGAPMTLTLVAGNVFVERKVTVGATDGTLSETEENVDTGLLLILGFAFLGGMILNLMPCVLPVLSLKILAAVSYGGKQNSAIRVGFLTSAFGILVSFLMLAGAAIGLKEAGVAVGWGIQFQQPLFLAFMASLVTLFAANLWGLFEVPLPRFIADLGARLPSDAAGGESGGKSLAGHFLTGMFATLLATPCSAPFLGTAIGFALSRGALEILSVFAFMGLGLATPYLAVAAFPAIARAFPKPGAWMNTLRKFLSLALAATAVWLLSVMMAQMQIELVAGVAAILLGFVAVLAWVRTDRLRLLASVASVVFAIGLASFAEKTETVNASTAGAWQVFDRATIAERVAAGEIVLVDVTADWCLTCKVNKRLVLDTGRIAALIGEGGVVALKADWTNPSNEIADYLASFGRYGIPFNAVYGPSAPNGIALPELLTEEGVLAAIRDAGGANLIAHLDTARQ